MTDHIQSSVVSIIVDDWDERWDNIKLWRKVWTTLQTTRTSLLDTISHINNECDEITYRLTHTDILELTLRMNRQKQQRLKDLDKLRFLQKKIEEVSLFVYTNVFDNVVRLWKQTYDMHEVMTHLIEIKLSYEKNNIRNKQI